jgi:glycosyltransferase involved in cell wall biosynthesis
MSPDIRVMALAKHWFHHTNSGGYDRLAREVGAEVVRRPGRSRWSWHRLARKLWRKNSQTCLYLLDYEYEDLLAERNLLRQAKSHRPEVVHVLYGDEQLDLLLRQRSRLPCPLVATFHLPCQRVRDRFEFFQKDLLNGINAAVVVSRCQLPDFRRWLGPERVVYVPHGIDTRRFAPGVNRPQRHGVRLLTVGHHMRDFRALRRIMDACAAFRLPTQFDLVLPRQYWPLFNGCHNVRIQTGIGEPELIRRYQVADALLLPVIDATANNSVLESLASGTPVITNAVGGIPDYVNDHCGWLFDQGNVAGMVELIAAMSRHREIAASRREAARRQALEFDWMYVARQMRVVYKAVANGLAPGNAMKTRRPIPNEHNAGIDRTTIWRIGSRPGPLSAAC